MDSRVLVIDRVATPWFVFGVGGAGTGQDRAKDPFAQHDQRGERADRIVGYLIAAGTGNPHGQVFGAQLPQVVGSPGGGVFLAGARAPSPMKRFAIASPMPRPAPVTITDLPFSSS